MRRQLPWLLRQWYAAKAARLRAEADFLEDGGDNLDLYKRWVELSDVEYKALQKYVRAGGEINFPPHLGGYSPSAS